MTIYEPKSSLATKQISYSPVEACERSAKIPETRDQNDAVMAS